MDFTYDDEQQALRDAVRGLIGKKYSDFETRRQTVAADPGFDETTWSRLAELGALGLPFSEDDGGAGAGPIEVAIVAQELGRVIAPEPYLTSVVLAGGLVADAGSDSQRAEILGALSAGESILAFAHRSEEHTSELQSLMRISYAVFCLKNKKKPKQQSIYCVPLAH